MSRENKTVLERFWHGFVSQIPCLVCSRFVPSQSKMEHHHCLDGVEFSIVPLCAEHHAGPNGLHGLKPPAFCARYEVPGLHELGLLVWLIEDIAKYLRVRLRG